jgi:hypothetical protein
MVSNFVFTKFDYWCQKSSKFCADLETVEKNAKKLLTERLL